MPTDALTQFQAQTTKTASFNGAGVFFATGTPRRGEKVRVIYSAASNATGSNTVLFTVDISKDGGTTYYTEAQADPITLSTAVQSGEIFIPWEVTPTSVSNGIYARVSVAFAGAGSTPTITYAADLVLSRP